MQRDALVPASALLGPFGTRFLPFRCKSAQSHPERKLPPSTTILFSSLLSSLVDSLANIVFLDPYAKE